VIYIRIGGILDISTKDIPGKASMVIFTVGCNYNCEFCHNKYLLYPNVGNDVKISDIIEKVKSNQLVGSVNITGGEPTLQDDLLDFCKEISKLGKYISIDTNGSNPDIINEIIPYINRIALDLKTTPLDNDKYKEITRVNSDSSLIIRSFCKLNESSNIDLEIRTTYVENLLNPEDIHEIILFLQKNNFNGSYVLQQYQYSEGVGIEFKEKFEKPLHSSLLDILKPYSEKDLEFNIYLRSDVVGYKSIDELFDIKKN